MDIRSKGGGERMNGTLSQMESYEDIKPKAEKKRQQVINLLKEHPEGLTAWDIARLLSTTGSYHRQDYAPRISELVERGIVAETGKSRTTETGKRGEIYQLYEIWRSNDESI